MTARRVGEVLAKTSVVALVLAYLAGTVAYAAAWSVGPAPEWAFVLGWVAVGLLALGVVAAAGTGVAWLVGPKPRLVVDCWRGPG